MVCERGRHMKVAYSPTSMVAITIHWLVGSFVMFHVQMLVCYVPWKISLLKGTLVVYKGGYYTRD